MSKKERTFYTKTIERICGNDKENLKIKVSGFVGLILLVLVLCTGNVLAAPVIIRSFTQEGNPALLWYVRDVEGETDKEHSKVLVGNSEGDIEAFGKLQELEGVLYKTTILVDNSLSISEENRNKGKALVKALLDQHAAGEEFIIYTVDTELHLAAPDLATTDYEGLKARVDEITHQNQDEYLVECLMQVLEDNRSDDAGYYNRVVIISDGKDDNSMGHSYGDLVDVLREDAMRCPIYTMACVWDKDSSGMKELSSIAVASNGQYFVLDEEEDMEDLAQRMNAADYNADYYTINIPLKEKDGQEKEVELTLKTSEGEYVLQRQVDGLVRTSDEEQMFQEETMETMEAITELGPETEYVRQPVLLIPDTEEEESKEDTHKKTYAVEPWMIVVGLFMVLAIAAFAILVIVKRRREKVWDDEVFYEKYYQEHPNKNERNTQQDQNPVRSSPQWDESGQDSFGSYSGNGNIPPDSTVAMWGLKQQENGRIQIGLEDIKNPEEQYSFFLSEEFIVGRSSQCDLIIATDKSVSKRHLRMMPWQGEVVVEDLQSTNGTSINGHRLQAMEQLRDGDILTIGNKQFRVYMRKA